MLIFQYQMILLVVFSAQGALLSPTKKNHGVKTTISPNDVIEPSVVRPTPPIKQSSSRTDMLVGALSVTSALLPYLNYFTSFLPKGQAEEAAAPTPSVSHAVVTTNNVSRQPREVTEDVVAEGVLDTFIGSILGPYGVIVEVASILIDVLAFTEAEGLTDPISFSRKKRDLYQETDLPQIRFGTDFAIISSPGTHHVSAIDYSKYFDNQFIAVSQQNNFS